MAQTAVPTGNAGELFIPALGKTIKQVEWREDDFYDTIQLDALTPTAGSQFEFFRDLTSKNLQHTNLKTQRRIPAGSEFILTRIGIVPNQALGANLLKDDDTIMLAYAATLSFKINDRLISEGPLVKYQSGMGVTGSTTRNGTGVVTIGIPSAAAAPTLLVAQSIKDDDDLMGTVTFFNNSWINGGASLPTFSTRPGISLYLHGLIKKPQGK